MTRRRIPDETKELALSMSLQGISDLEIRELTGISERTVKRLRRTFRNSGSTAGTYCIADAYKAPQPFQFGSMVD